MPSKKGSKTKKVRTPNVKTSAAEQTQTIAELRRQLAESAKELQDCRRQLAEGLENQAAASEVLGIISRSPTDVQPVLDAIVESAARVCGVDDVGLRLREGNLMVSRAHFGPVPITRVQISVDEPYLHWMREHGTLHIPDINEQPELPLQYFSGNWRTALFVPFRQ